MKSTAVALSAKQIKALEKIERQEKNLERITEANNWRFQDECDNFDLAVPTPPERKIYVDITDDCRPFLSNYSFVKVEADTSPGNNRPPGFGYIKSSFGVGVPHVTM